MARWIARHGYVPQYALCSDAVRTRQTWELVADVWYGTFGPPPVSMEPDLYLASPYGIRALIGRTGEDIESLLVLGHNPGMHDLASTFVARDGSELHRLLDRKFPTAAAAVLEFDVSDWSPGDREVASTLVATTASDRSNVFELAGRFFAAADGR